MSEKNLQRQIYLVDDDAAIREILTLTVQEAGYSVKAFSTGRDMLRELQSGIPDAVLLDYFLPGENTERIINQMRKKDKGIFIILISADFRAFEISRKLYVDAFLQKPFQMNAVLDILSENT